MGFVQGLPHSCTEYGSCLSSNQAFLGRGRFVIGRIIGNYQITSELARGEMGMVYRAQHMRSPREVIIKSILLAPFSTSAQVHLKARFRREAFIQKQFDHPNMVRVYEFITTEDKYFLVMEYIQGVSLRDLLAR